MDDFKLETSLKIYQNAQISRVNLNAGDQFCILLKQTLMVYVMQVYGISTIENQQLNQRCLGISNVNQFEIVAQQESQLLFIEVPEVVV